MMHETGRNPQTRIEVEDVETAVELVGMGLADSVIPRGAAEQLLPRLAPEAGLSVTAPPPVRHPRDRAPGRRDALARGPADDRAGHQADPGDRRARQGALSLSTYNPSSGTLPSQQVALDRLVDALVAGVVAGVAVAVATDQHAGLELVGQRLGPLVGRGRVAGRADDDDRRRPRRRDRQRRLGRRRPVPDAAGAGPTRTRRRTWARPPRTRGSAAGPVAGGRA